MESNISLRQFLVSNRQQILKQSEDRIITLAALRPTSDQLKNGLPIFFDHLLRVLDKEPDTVSASDELKILDTSCEYGREFWKLGYTLSHVVHAFGALCQATTEIARERDAPITAHEFHHLNRCLDIAIAGAVTEFESSSVRESKKREALHLGFISHELRNALNRARISFQMLSKGIVGLGGSTSKVLEKSLEDMDVLISRSISEVRLRANSPIEKQRIAVIEAISKLAITAEFEAARRHQTLSLDIDPECIIMADRILFMSAVGNLLHNALKYSEDGGHISVTGIKKVVSI
jgi:signal transduction histidine kinase